MAWFECTGGSESSEEIKNFYIRIIGSGTSSLSGPCIVPITDSLNYIPIDYTKDWTIKIRTKITSFNNNFVTIGTATYNRYYDNPSAEIQSNGNSIWVGISYNGSSWGGEYSVNFSETFALNTWYDIEFSFIASTKVAECKVTKVSNGEVIGDNTKTLTNDIYQPNNSNYPLCFGNVAFATRFTYLKDQMYDFANSYIENDGNIIWGNK